MGVRIVRAANFIKTLDYYGMDSGKIVFQHDDDARVYVACYMRVIRNEVLDWLRNLRTSIQIEDLWHFKGKLSEYVEEPRDTKAWKQAESSLGASLCRDNRKHASLY
jgi:hypothetical protein